MRADVVVLGAGKSGLAAARAAAKAGADVLVVEPGEAPADVPFRVLCARAHDLVPAPDGSVGGVLAASGRDAVLVEARAVVLACGGVGGLWDARFPNATGDALALAHRAGAALRDLDDLRVEEDGRVWTAGGVVADRHGRTTVPHLFATGAATGGGVGGIAAGEWAAAHLAPAGRGLAPVPLHEIDTPLPEGFADAKMDRLRRVMATHLPPRGPRDPDAAFHLLHALKGEADDFARARVDADVWAWKDACEAALLVASAFRARRAGGPRGA